MNRSDDEAPPPPRGAFRALIEHFPNGVLVLFDRDLTYRVVGPTVLPFSGREAAEMVGRSVKELFPESTVASLAPELRATIEGESRSFDIEYDGRIHHLETQPIDLDGDRYGMLVTQDVSDERRLARELEATNERLDEFASMVSHDLRNPIAIGRGRLELFRETGDRTALDAVEEALERIDELTTDLTELARYGRGVGEREPVSIERVAREAWRMVDTKDADLRVEDAELVGDPGQLQALFENLFRNAIGHGGHDVTVHVGPLDGGFYVEDTGRGIPPELHDDVFDHGFSTGYGGSGVGLTIVGRIAAAHDLAIELIEGSTGGARFEFRPVDADAGDDSSGA